MTRTTGSGGGYRNSRSLSFQALLLRRGTTCEFRVDTTATPPHLHPKEKAPFFRQTKADTTKTATTTLSSSTMITSTNSPQWNNSHAARASSYNTKRPITATKYETMALLLSQSGHYVGHCSDYTDSTATTATTEESLSSLRRPPIRSIVVATTNDHDDIDNDDTTTSDISMQSQHHDNDCSRQDYNDEDEDEYEISESWFDRIGASSADDNDDDHFSFTDFLLDTYEKEMAVLLAILDGCIPKRKPATASTTNQSQQRQNENGAKEQQQQHCLVESVAVFPNDDAIHSGRRRQQQEYRVYL